MIHGEVINLGVGNDAYRIAYPSIEPNDTTTLAVIPFVAPVPERKIALVWRRNFPRSVAIEMLRQSILDCALPGVTMLDNRKIAA